MKCLFVTSKSPDYISACTYDGLQEVLGEANVVDAVGCPWLHRSSLEKTFGGGPHPEFFYISGSREGRTLSAGEDEFDLLVINACFIRDAGWDLVGRLMGRIKTKGKVAYIEGWDAAWHVEPPRMLVDAVFRREISPAVTYPYECHHLSFAMPSRLFLPDVEIDRERPFDLFFAGNPNSCHPDRPVRWQMLRRVFETRNSHHSVISTAHLGGFEPYWDLMRRSKLALVPPGADDCESLRCYEAAACGAVPVLIGYPPYRREPWFTGEMSFSCPVDQLTEHLDEALGNDQTNKRRALMAHARKFHTTRARAEKLLEVLG